MKMRPYRGAEKIAPAVRGHIIGEGSTLSESTG
jgi:hypothetical protein